VVNKNLIIIFTRNPELGKVKSRLSKTVGDKTALEVYKYLLNYTEKTIRNINCDKAVYYSNSIKENDIWDTSIYHKHEQKGNNLGQRMHNAFKQGFNDGYEKIILIGSDLPDISEQIIKNSMDALKQNDVVFGPAEDGGYYLIGLTKMHTFIFDHKPWSQSHLLEITLNELKKHQLKVSLLKTLNDIDTFEDLKKSSLFKIFNHD